MVYKILLWLTMLFGIAQGNCLRGCLLCKPDGDCRLCDVNSGYKLGANNQCTQTTVDNCNLYAADGSCLRCNANNYLVNDGGNQTCQATTAVANCAFYSGPSTCSQCAQGKFLDGNQCSSPAQVIQRCLLYGTNATSCVQCSVGFIPNGDATKCNALPSTPTNCSKYSSSKCNRCDANAIEVRNSYLTYPFDAAGNSYLDLLIYNFNTPFTNATSLGKCLTIAVENCATVLSYRRCSVCNDGYYLNTDFGCTKAPNANLAFCDIPVDDYNCRDCIQGFMTNNNGGCVPVTAVDNCSFYSITEDKCLRCNEDKILNETDNACDDRVTIVENCATHNATLEECEICAENFVLYNNNTNCYAAIEDCAEYLATDPDVGYAVCNTCGNNYYLASGDNIVCTAGSIDNCLIYENSTGNCKECGEDYYLSEGQCVLRTIGLPMCDIYEPLVDGDCKTCSFDSHPYTLNNRCILFVAVDNCAEYEDVNTCVKCEDYHNLVEADNTCTAISHDLHCLTQKEGICIRCEDDYNLREEQCYKNYVLDTCQCEISNPEKLGIDYECAVCKTNSIPVDLTSLSTCFNNDEANLDLIDNCDKHIYDEKTGSLSCDTCADDYYMTDIGECVETCPDEYINYYGAIVKRYGDENYSSILKSCQSADRIIDNCDIAANSITDFSSTVCLACSDNFVPLKACKARSYFSKDVSTPKNIAQAFSTVDCQDENTSKTIYPDGAISSDCKTYALHDNAYHCVECHFGYTGVVINAPNGYGYVTCSAEVLGCDTDVVYGTAADLSDDWTIDMFGFSLSENFTCHKCTSDSEIPFLHLSYFNNLRAYGLSDNQTNPSNSNTFDGKLIECRSPVATTFGLQAGDFNFPDHCALGLFIINEDKSANYTNGTIRCVACKNGYKSVLNADKSYITECAEISNCDIDSTEAGIFNGCRTCESEYGHPVGDDHIIDYTICGCIDNGNNSCDAFNEERECFFCKPGFMLIREGVCDKITVPDCDDFGNTYNFYITDEEQVSVPLGSALYYFNSRGSGCKYCNNNTHAFSLSFDSNSRNRIECHVSDNLTQNVDSSDLGYIQNCSQYLNQLDFQCAVCEENFVVSLDGSECFANTNLSNCNIAASDSECQECKSTYVKVGAGCELPNIENCVSYTGGAQVDCTSCEEGYYLQNNACVLGEIENCKVYNNEGECKVCDDNYVVLDNVCIEYSLRSDCLRFSFNDQNTEVTCEKCPADYELLDFDCDEEQDICMTYNLVSGCSKHEDGLCTECEPAYYFDNNDCIIREFVVENCKTHTTDADNCEVCEDGYEKSIDSLSCTYIETGIPYCAVYKSATACQFCDDNRYVVNGECVLTDTPIANCKLHKDASNCKTCEDGFLLTTSKTCDTIVAENCFSYSNVYTCSNCSNGFMRATRAGSSPVVTDCIEIPNAENCEESNAFNGKCRFCAYPYFPSTGASICETTAADPVPNCKYLKDASTCNRCDRGYTLSVDLRSCVSDRVASNEHMNCSDIRYVDRPVCTACSASYYFSSSSCVACSASVTSNCMFCNPSDNKKCLVCKPGYTMTQLGACIINSDANLGIEGDEDDLADADESAYFMSSWLLLILLVKAFMF